MENTKNKNILLIGIFILLLIVLVFLTKKNDSKDNNVANIKNQYVILNDINEFFTVEGCVNRYIDVLNNKESDNLLKLLSKDYIDNNSITQSNVLNKLDSFEGKYTFNAKKIYVHKIDENHNDYYVYGKIKKDSINNNDLGDDYYTIVKIDNSKLLFSITPYDGSVFKEER